MKIILGTESFSPNISGVAVATEVLASNLTKAGHDVWVFCPSTGKAKNPSKDRDFQKFNVIRLRSLPNPFRKGFRFTYSGKKEIEKLVSEIKPDLIHIQDIATIGNDLRDIGRKYQIPVIVTNHFSLEFAMSYLKFLKPAIPLFRSALIKYLVSFYNKCDYVITPTETIAKQVRSWGVKTPVIAKSNGIFFDRFNTYFTQDKIKEFKLHFQLPDNPIVLYTGRIDADKSIDVLINAIPLVLKKVNAHFVLAGSGDLIGKMEGLAKELNIGNAVTFLGRLDNTKDEFILLYKSASVFATASIIETQSLVTLEAMASGLPVVAADANALPELVKDGLNGFLFEPGNSKAMARRIITILKHKKTAARMGRESVGIASHHEMSKAFGSILNLYHEIIDENRARKNLRQGF